MVPIKKKYKMFSHFILLPYMAEYFQIISSSGHRECPVRLKV